MVIVFGSRKGGVGKTTILCNLAVAMKKAGLTVCVIDGDPLKSATDWATARSELDHVEQVTVLSVVNTGKQLMNAIKTMSPNYNHVLVDLAGVADETNAIILGMADMVISPFKASNLDLNSLPELDDLLQKFKIIRPQLQIRYILNALRHNIPKELTESIRYFQTFDIKPVDAVLYDRKAWKETMGSGLSVLESNDDKAASELLLLFRELFTHPISENTPVYS
jgi:chromosome partitioning protein